MYVDPDGKKTIIVERQPDEIYTPCNGAANELFISLEINFLNLEDIRLLKLMGYDIIIDGDSIRRDYKNG